MSFDEGKRISCVILGDSMVGKTSICKTLTGATKMNKDDTATISEEYCRQMVILGHPVTFKIRDFSGQHDYQKTRTPHYKDSDVFLVCYSANDRDTFDSVEKFWIPEIREQYKKATVVLVATSENQKDDSTFVGKEEGHVLMNKHKIDAFVDCVCDDHESVEQLFEDIWLTISKPKKRRRSSILQTLHDFVSK